VGAWIGKVEFGVGILTRPLGLGWREPRELISVHRHGDRQLDSGRERLRPKPELVVAYVRQRLDDLISPFMVPIVATIRAVTSIDRLALASGQGWRRVGVGSDDTGRVHCSTLWAWGTCNHIPDLFLPKLSSKDHAVVIRYSAEYLSDGSSFVVQSVNQ
jgi:hypothetical protein